MTHARRPPSGQSAEEELLLCCARPGDDASNLARAAALAAKGVDAGRLTELATQQQLAPVLLARLNRIAPSVVPGALRRRAQAQVRQSLALCGALIHVLALLDEAGIRALAFKGPVLSQIVYGNPAQRPICDLDLLVALEEVWRAAGALRAADFRARHDYTPRQRAAYLRTEDEYNLAREDGTMVELHWELLPGRRASLLEFESLRRRAVTVTIAGGEVPTLAAEDHLLLLAAHAAKHRWQPLRLLADIAGLIHASESLEWNVTVERAQSAGGARVLLVALALARNLLGAAVPGDLTDRAASDAVVSRLVEEIAATLFQPLEQLPSRSRDAGRSLWSIPAGERAARAWRTLVSPTKADWLWVRLPDTAYPLYYALRPVRLLLERASRREGVME